MSREEHGFQFTPFGMIPLGQPVPVASEEAAPAAVPRVQPAAFVAPPMVFPEQPYSEALDGPRKPVTGRELVRMARGRVKELRRELAKVPAMKRELDEMLRLIDAAKTKPARVVRLRSGTHD